MKPQTIIPLLFIPKYDTKYKLYMPTRAKEYLFGEYAEALEWCKSQHGRTFRLGAPLATTSSLTLDELTAKARGPNFPPGHACGANLCRNAITEMAEKHGFRREDPSKLFYLEFFRPPLPPADMSFYGAGGQDGRADWTGLDVPAISGMCYTSDHKTWMACGVSTAEMQARGWTNIPDFATVRGARVGSKMHEIGHATGVNWHTNDDPLTPQDDRFDSPMFNYFNFPQKYSHDDSWLWQTPGTVAEGARWVKFLPDEWQAIVSAGGLSA